MSPRLGALNAEGIANGTRVNLPIVLVGAVTP